MESSDQVLKEGCELLFIKPMCVDVFPADVNTWLVVFGFHLHNSIPGFPVPKSGITRVSYELAKSEVWDNLPVSTLFTYKFIYGILLRLYSGINVIKKSPYNLEITSSIPG